MTTIDAKLVKELKEIARRDGWSIQRTKSMLGILKSTPPEQRPALIKTIKERRIMSRRKYKLGKRLTSVAEFDQSTKQFYIIRFGNDLGTRSRKIIISWQYKTIKDYIENGHLFEADEVEA